MAALTRAAYGVAGPATIAGDKSVSHRALIGSALAQGTSRVRGILAWADVQSTAGVLRALGVPIPALSESMEIVGTGRESLRAPTADLDCGNSGTSARLLAGGVAGAGLTVRVVLDASL